jgi:hypothetical protein
MHRRLSIAIATGKLSIVGEWGVVYLHVPHFLPSFAQRLQYLQFLQAWQGSAPTQVAAQRSVVRLTGKASKNAIINIRVTLDFAISFFTGASVNAKRVLTI